MRGKTVPTQHAENGIEVRTKEINFSLFCYHFNYVVDLPDASALLAIDKQYDGNGYFLITGNNRLSLFKCPIFFQETKQT